MKLKFKAIRKSSGNEILDYFYIGKNGNVLNAKNFSITDEVKILQSIGEFDKENKEIFIKVN